MTRREGISFSRFSLSVARECREHSKDRNCKQDWRSALSRRAPVCSVCRRGDEGDRDRREKKARAVGRFLGAVSARGRRRKSAASGSQLDPVARFRTTAATVMKFESWNHGEHALCLSRCFWLTSKAFWVSPLVPFLGSASSPTLWLCRPAIQAIRSNLLMLLPANRAMAMLLSRALRSGHLTSYSACLAWVGCSS